MTRAGRGGSCPSAGNVEGTKSLAGPMQPLSRRFFQRDAVTVARDLLGRVLVSEKEGVRTVGRIVETEGYAGPGDRAAHVAGGRRTKRTEVFWEAGGVAYVYLIYGMHHCFNVVTGKQGAPSAVLVRAVSPVAGLEGMAQRRGRVLPVVSRGVDGWPVKQMLELTSGPGRLAAAFSLVRGDTGRDVTRPPVWVARGKRVPDEDVVAAARVGVEYAGADAKRLYRFLVRGDPFVSRPWPAAHRRAVAVARGKA